MSFAERAFSTVPPKTSNPQVWRPGASANSFLFLQQHGLVFVLRPVDEYPPSVLQLVCLETNPYLRVRVN
jgi:hypothetical protein